MPTLVLAVLQALDDAYETAAGVRIVEGALATQDVDLLWDARKRVRFMIDLEKLDTSMLGVLRRADPTFERKQGHNETAINAKGFEVDFLRRLTTAQRFEHVVVSATGRMALMRTIAPAAFVEFKRWMAKKALHRAEMKKRRNLRQADIVQKLIDEGFGRHSSAARKKPGCLRWPGFM